LSIKTAGLKDYPFSLDKQDKTLHSTLIRSALVFVIAYLILFFGMSLRPNIYDESIILTGAMRVAAGQIPHRDFYANYGPAQFYILAGLFRLFGESILIERLFDLFVRALVVASVYAITSLYCRRSIAICASFLALLWLFGLYYSTVGTAVLPVSLLNLIGTVLILPVFTRNVSRRRMFAVGVLCGMAWLFRYDTGIALLGIQACVMAIAIYLRLKEKRLHTWVSTFWPYLLGLAVMILPAALYYLSIAPLHFFVHDIILYPGKYYHRGRNLPFPPISLGLRDDIEVYLPIAIIGISLYAVVAGRLRTRDDEASGFQSSSEEHRWQGFLIAFGLLALVMYFKGFVRISVVQLYLTIIPSLLLLAVLFQRRLTFPSPVRISIVLLVWLSVLSAIWNSRREMKDIYVQHSSVPGSIFSSIRENTPVIRSTWCKSVNAVTRGFCFLPEDNRIQVIEFIESHTRPDQRLYVGLAKHDRVFANDNLIYFASQRIPATRWSHFDPGLQNRYDIQTQMINELEGSAPPYIVLDSEFEQTTEPNDSSKSTGVTLLDDYLRRKYQLVQIFGDLSVWQRIPVL
jgi:hypothetical protein